MITGTGAGSTAPVTASASGYSSITGTGAGVVDSMSASGTGQQGTALLFRLPIALTETITLLPPPPPGS